VVDELTVDVVLTDAAGDELAVLGAEIDDEDELGSVVPPARQLYTSGRRVKM